METNETNETLFFVLLNQMLRCPKLTHTSKKSKKCGILPHSDPHGARPCWRIKERARFGIGVGNYKGEVEQFEDEDSKGLSASPRRLAVALFEQAIQPGPLALG